MWASSEVMGGYEIDMMMVEEQKVENLDSFAL
jgi:hypothetical protein